MKIKLNLYYIVFKIKEVLTTRFIVNCINNRYVLVPSIHPLNHRIVINLKEKLVKNSFRSVSNAKRLNYLFHKSNIKVP